MRRVASTFNSWGNAVRRILLVDDDPDIREALAEALAADGNDVRTAENGRAALASARADRPDVIVLDLMMPVMNGWEFRRIQRDDADLAGIPVIVISAGRPGRDLDAAAFLPKPFPLDAILDAVERCAAAPLE